MQKTRCFFLDQFFGCFRGYISWGEASATFIEDTYHKQEEEIFTKQCKNITLFSSKEIKHSMKSKNLTEGKNQIHFVNITPSL